MEHRIVTGSGSMVCHCIRLKRGEDLMESIKRVCREKKIAETLENLADGGTVDVIHPEREITFTANGKKYKVVLSCPRS